MNHYITGDYNDAVVGFETLVLSDVIAAAKEDRQRRHTIETVNKLMTASFEAFIGLRNTNDVEQFDTTMVSIERLAELNLGLENAKYFKFDFKKFDFKAFIKKIIEWLKKLIKDSYAFLVRAVHDCITRINLSFKTRASFIQVLEKYIQSGGPNDLTIEAKFGMELVDILKDSSDDIDCLDIKQQAEFLSTNFTTLANFNTDKYTNQLNSILDVALKRYSTPDELIAEVSAALYHPVSDARKYFNIVERDIIDGLGPISELINTGIFTKVSDDKLYSGREVLSSSNFGGGNRIVFIPPANSKQIDSPLKYLANSGLAIRTGFAQAIRSGSRAGEVIKQSVKVTELLAQLKATHALSETVSKSVGRRKLTKLDKIFIRSNEYLDKFNAYAALLDSEGINEQVAESCRDILLVMNVFKDIEEVFGPRLVTTTVRFIAASDAVAKTLYTAILYANKVGKEGHDEFPFPSVPEYFDIEPKLAIESFDVDNIARFNKSISLVRKELEESKVSLESIDLIEKILK